MVLYLIEDVIKNQVDRYIVSQNGKERDTPSTIILLTSHNFISTQFLL